MTYLKLEKNKNLEKNGNVLSVMVMVAEAKRERASAKSGQSVSHRRDERQNGNAPFLNSSPIAFFARSDFRSNYFWTFSTYFSALFQQPSIISNQCRPHFCI